MRVTFLLPTVGLSGGIKVVAIYARILVQRGHDVFLLSPPPKPVPLRSKLKSLIKGKRWPSPLTRPKSHLDGSGLNHRILDRWRAPTDDDVPDGDVVVATWWETAEWVYNLSDSKGAKVYFVQHHEVFHYLPVERARATYRLPMHKIVIARWLQDLMREMYSDAAVDLVPNSVDLAQFHAARRGRQTRPTVGFLYHDVSFKGVDITLSAVSILKKLYPNLRVICFGSIFPLRKLPLEDWIEFHHSPAQNTIKDLYAQCDVWVTASRSEGFNLPAMEAMACRTPVVASRTGWPEEAIATGKNGVLVDVEDIDGLVRGVEYILNLPDEEWRKMSYQAFETVALSSWDASTTLFEKALENVCARASHEEILGRRQLRQSSHVPIFLVGSVRSGTTLLRLMLDHHPEIAFNLDSEFLVSQIADDGSFPDSGNYCEWLKSDRVFQHSHFELKDGLDFVGLVKDFLEQKRTRDGKAIVGATIHRYFSRIGRIWPEAKYIYLFRDGRDVARSIMQMGWKGNTYVAADWWLEAEVEWERYRGTLPGGSWIELSYEDLLADPVKELIRICHFLGVDYSDRMLDYVKDSSYKLPDVSLIKQWENGMSKEMVQKVEEKIGDRLLLRGYELSDYPRITLSKIEKKYLRLHSRIGAIVFRVRKYSTMLVIREFITRRLGLKKQNRRIRRILHQIDDAALK
jgi:glycosyltransferase involved in cell wall biosynthesis